MRFRLKVTTFFRSCLLTNKLHHINILTIFIALLVDGQDSQEEEVQANDPTEGNTTRRNWDKVSAGFFSRLFC